MGKMEDKNFEVDLLKTLRWTMALIPEIHNRQLSTSNITRMEFYKLNGGSEAMQLVAEIYADDIAFGNYTFEEEQSVTKAKKKKTHEINEDETKVIEKEDGSEKDNEYEKGTDKDEEKEKEQETEPGKEIEEGVEARVEEGIEEGVEERVEEGAEER